MLRTFPQIFASQDFLSPFHNLPSVMVYNKSRLHFFLFLFMPSLIWLPAVVTDVYRWHLLVNANWIWALATPPFWPCLLVTFWHSLFLLSFLYPVIWVLFILFLCTQTKNISKFLASLQRLILIISFFLPMSCLLIKFSPGHRDTTFFWLDCFEMNRIPERKICFWF